MLDQWLSIIMIIIGIVTGTGLSNHLRMNLYSEIIVQYAEIIECNGQVDNVTNYFVDPWVVNDHIGYMLNDLDGDGYNELLIMEKPKAYDGNGSIYAVFTISKGKVIKVMSGWPRNCVYLLNSGQLYSEGSDGAEYQSQMLYRLEDGNIVFVDGYTNEWGMVNGEYQPIYYKSLDGSSAVYGKTDCLERVEEQIKDNWCTAQQNKVVTETSGWHLIVE